MWWQQSVGKFVDYTNTGEHNLHLDYFLDLWTRLPFYLSTGLNEVNLSKTEQSYVCLWQIPFETAFFKAYGNTKIDKSNPYHL